MRITNIGLYSSNQSGDYTEVITFSLRYPDPSSQYIVRNIIGMDADDIVPKFYGFGSNTKSRFYDFGMKAREIVLRITLNPRFRLDESYSDIRDDLYRTISATRTGLIMLHFNSGGTTVARIGGFITKFESSYFTETPEVQLTIRCDDPMFRAINPVVYESTDLKTTNPIIIGDSISTAPHGFSMQMTFKSAPTWFVIQDVPTNPEWVFKIIPSGGFLSGDVLYFSSDYSNKYLYIIRGANTIHLVDRIEPNSIWPILFPGSNEFHFSPLEHIDWNILEYYPAYWGV